MCTRLVTRVSWYKRLFLSRMFIDRDLPFEIDIEMALPVSSMNLDPAPFLGRGSKWTIHQRSKYTLGLIFRTFEETKAEFLVKLIKDQRWCTQCGDPMACRNIPKPGSPPLLKDKSS